MSSMLEDERPSPLPVISGLTALGNQAQQFRCQVASGVQQKFDNVVRAVTERFPQDRYVEHRVSSGESAPNRRCGHDHTTQIPLAAAEQHEKEAFSCMGNADHRPGG